jgi:hypothetical protein
MVLGDSFEMQQPIVSASGTVNQTETDGLLTATPHFAQLLELSAI